MPLVVHAAPNTPFARTAMIQAQFEDVIAKTVSWPAGLPTHFPTDQELKAVSKLIKEESVQLEALDSELTRLKTILSGLEKERRSLAWQMEAHQAYIAPARRLPDDMVREIMIRCIPTDTPPSHHNPHIGPPLLAHICSHWRTIALSTPSLWSSLCVSFRLLGPRLSPSHPDFTLPPMQMLGESRDIRPLSLWQKDVDIMRHWLTLAGSCPLTLSFGRIPDFSDVPCIQNFLQSIIDMSARWQNISLIPTIPKQSPQLPLSFRSAVAAQQSPHLQSIRFPVLDLSSAPVPELSWTNSEVLKSPVLHSLECTRESSRFHNAAGCNSPLSLLPIGNWRKITTLILSCKHTHEVEDCIMVLGTHIGSALEVFSLKSITTAPEAHLLTEQNFNLKLFPRLHTLDLDLPQDFLQMILRMVATPSLQDLSIQMSGVYRVIPDSIAADLLQYIEQSSLTDPDRSCASVSALRLDPIHYTRQTFYHILETFSGVKKLVFKTEEDGHCWSLRHPNLLQRGIFAKKDLNVILNMDSNVDDEFLRRIANENGRDDAVTDTASTESVQFLPKLVDFTCFARTAFSLNTLTRFLRAKCHQDMPDGISRLEALRLIEVNEGYIGESRSLPARDVRWELIPFKQRGIEASIVSIYQTEGREIYNKS